MITAVFDTNVLASGFAGFLHSTSTPGQLLHAWRDGAFVLAVSEDILAELDRAFQAPYFRRRLTPDQVTRAIALLRTDAHLVSITVDVRGVAAHPEDDRILAAAVSAGADYLVTGDGPLRNPVGAYRGVTLISPRAFLEMLTSAEC